jgi:hypothetical protein
MILYVNGDSHTAGAEAVNQHAFAEDDARYFYMGRAPHPENLTVTWGKLLSQALNAGFHCAAESASSNTRIIRTTREFLKQWYLNRQAKLIIIQWSTWEREEWLHQGVYYQVNASGIDQVPQELQEKYRNYILGIDWQQKTLAAHKEIWDFHKELTQQDVPHIFFNGNCDFSSVPDQLDWGINYIDPYQASGTWAARLASAGYQTVAPNSWHFGKEAHSYFHRFMLQYCIDNKFI